MAVYEALIPICGGTVHFTLAQERSASTEVGQHTSLFKQCKTGRPSEVPEDPDEPNRSDRHTQNRTHEGVHTMNTYSEVLQNINFSLQTRVYKIEQRKTLT